MKSMIKGGRKFLVLKSILLVQPLNPKLQHCYMLLASEIKKCFIIPKSEFLHLESKASKRFKVIAPLAPYPHLLGLELKMNNTVFKWITRNLEKIQEKYKHLLEVENS